LTVHPSSKKKKENQKRKEYHTRRKINQKTEIQTTPPKNETENTGVLKRRSKKGRRTRGKRKPTRGCGKFVKEVCLTGMGQWIRRGSRRSIREGIMENQRGRKGRSSDIR